MTNGTQKNKVAYRSKVYAVDLFCGAGSLIHRRFKSGIDVRLGVDIDPACEYPYTTNNNAKFHHKSVDDLKVDELKQQVSPKDEEVQPNLLVVERETARSAPLLVVRKPCTRLRSRKNTLLFSHCSVCYRTISQWGLDWGHAIQER